jgi:hypothetical protein
MSKGKIDADRLNRICRECMTNGPTVYEDCNACRKDMTSAISAAAPPAKTDKINGGFEFVGGFFIILHILQVWYDQSVAGVNIYAVAFFTLWGYWNLYYYKSIKQQWSLVASYFITAMNTVWVMLLLYYR